MSFLLPLGIIGILFVSLVSYYSYQLKYGNMDTIPENLKSSAFTEGKALKNANTVALTEEVSLRPFNPTFGNKNAKITIVSFIDFECPYSQASYPIMRSLMEKHKDDIYFVFKHLPIEDLHPNSFEAALGASCAYGQKNFWDYYDMLFTYKLFDNESLLVYAESIGLDKSTFQSCLEKGQYTTQVQTDMKDGMALQITGTPTYFINNIKVQGVHDEKTWENIISKVKENL